MGDPPTTDASGMPRFSTGRDCGRDLPSPEAMLTWMYERCTRRHASAQTDESRTLYAQRMAVLRTVMHQCRVGDAEMRLAASEMTRQMNDISDDENSPNHSPINAPGSLGNAQRTVKFLQTLQLGASSSSGFSTNIDTMHNAIGRGNFPVEEDDESSDEAMETRSQMERRYMDSEQCEVSEPDLWVLLQYGEGSEREEST